MVRFCLTLALFAVPTMAQEERVVLAGSRTPRADPGMDQGPVESGFQLAHMTLLLKRTEAQKAALAKLLADQQNQKSPDYHHWLTPDEYAERFGAAQATVDRVTAWLKSMGFTILDVARGQNLIAFSGTAAEVEAAFETSIHRYRSQGEVHFVPLREPSIPASLEPFVETVLGLDDYRLKPLPKTGR